MLWEGTDPGAALRERFGFRDLGECTAWAGAVLTEHWGIRLRACSRLVISDHNAIAWLDSDAGPLVLKLSRERSRFAALAASTRLLHRLAALGVPVAAPLPARDGLVRLELDGPGGPLSLALLPEIQGDWLDVEDLSAVRSAGRTLAAVHEALRAAEEPSESVGEVSVEMMGEEPIERIRRWLAASDRGLVPEASRRLARLLEEASPLRQEQQLVHHDFRAANILVRDSAVVAVLDFDEVEPAHRVDDLARASVYLATRFTDWGPTPRPARAALREGYESLLPLSEAEAERLELLTLWYGLAAVRPGADGRSWASAL